jgi:CII-binding regulator of phage lambda lysogenization HflD
MELTAEEALEQEVERLIHSVRALEFRVSMQESAIKGLAGRIEELERR